MSGRLEGKTALVTGASGHLGFATARRFAAEGARLLLADAGEEDTRRAASAIGRAALATRIDVTAPESVAHAVALAKEAFGKIDILAHHAELRPPRDETPLALGDWERVLRFNLTGTFLTAQAVCREMMAQRSGSIVLTASTEYLGSARELDYAAAKGGVVSLMRSLSLELAQYKVRVNALAPGPLGDFDQIAAGALYLASDDSSLVSGHLLYVDDGLSVDGRR